MTGATKGSAQIDIAAPAHTVWALIVDVTRMGEWSPETHSAEWIDGSSQPVVGARFRGANHLGPIKWHTECVITDAEPGHVFAFTVVHPNGREETTWRYDFAATASGVTVTESYQFLWSPVASRIVEMIIPRDRQLRAGLAKTLERVKAAAEHSR